MHSDHFLRVVLYHYVRDVARTEFPNLKGLATNEFRAQVNQLSTRFEMASLESALDFLTGEYRPRRDLCLLTFDDGLREHYTEVMPYLHEKRIRGVFFLITGCLEEKRMAAVHMNHFLMAKMDFQDYADAFFRRVVSMCPDAFAPLNVDPDRAAQTYPWDPPEVARFKYLFHFGMDFELRDRAVRELFAEHIGPEDAFAERLYLNWDEARKMQKAGMAIGGHTHQHKPLANMNTRELSWDLEICYKLLRQNLLPQAVWSFSYPYGKKDSFHLRAVRKLQQLGFRCAFCTEVSDNRRGADPFTVGRSDCNKTLAATASGSA
jgi:peptidoglycan/xylan/chitin deacetylase (PgdA/CDA1 family)